MTHDLRFGSLSNAVVVITGASSGIGRAAALQFAAQGSHLVLAARRHASLQELAAECDHRAGGRVRTVVTDVTQPRDLEHLVGEALTYFGRIDVWVNNAGTTLFGRLDEGVFASHRHVIETNLLAPMYAARLLMPVFRRQGHGTLINIGSVLSQVGQAFVPAYAISKFGLRGLTDALRSEVADAPHIHVCSVLPYAVDTPHFQEAANVVGRQPFALPPVQDPERVARAIVRVAQRPRRQTYVPWYIPAGLVLHWLWPRAVERLLRHALERFHLVGPQAPTDGALFHARDVRGTVRGVRRPVVSTPAFVVWAMGDVVGMVGAWWRGRFTG